MAFLMHSPTGSGPVGEFEQKLVQHLLTALPNTYRVLPNFSLREQDRRAYEYDVVVLAPHAVFVIEAKEWYGRLSGDDTEWVLNRNPPRRCPLWLCDQKGKVLKGRLGGIGSAVWVEPLLVVPDGLRNELAGNWAHSVVTLGHVAAVLQDRHRVKYPSSTPLSHDAIAQALQGAWLARRRDQKRRVGSYELIETIAQDGDTAEYLARRAVAPGPDLFRVRTWALSPYLYPDAQERKRREAVIRRPAEALARIGRHPNLLPILAFDYDEDDHEFFEVTEWSSFGTLHGYLRSERDQLTVRERLEIAAGVAAALEAVHAQGLVHRNVSPETILIGFDRQPRLTDFDRAYIERSVTVYADTAQRGRNPAYLPPELADVSSYDFDTASDMYSFGVLLYELLAGQVPFANPAAALAAGGRPETLPSSFRDGIDGSLDVLIGSLLRVDNFQARPSAEAALAAIRSAVDGSSAGSAETHANGALPVQHPPGSQFAIGEVVPGTALRIDHELGGGSFSRVYKVTHLDQHRTFAMKVLTRAEDADLMLAEYNEIGRFLPRHRNIARLEWMDRLPPPHGTLYILSEYVDGETLEPYCDGRKRLSWSEVREVGLKLLGALAALHGDPLDDLAVRNGSRDSVRDPAHVFLHRDIKPANILLELPAGTPKLIDFNIAAPLAEATGRAGTPRYWAPDRGQPTWRADHDLFSLGVVLYELITERHPFPEDRPEAGPPYDPRAICPDLALSDALSEFLLKAVQPTGGARFASAREMAAALKAVPSMHAPRLAAPVLPAGEVFPGITLEPWEVGKRNYNPYVTRILTLYSQARRTNSGTRGLDEIARLTYVPTRLDTQLAPEISDGHLRLVVVTGNAGDGKTAFLQRVEDHFRGLGAAVEVLPGGNGSRWTYHGLDYETNYDGSQDEGDVESDAVLTRFFAPFSGDVHGGISGKAVRLIAINEGRLLDFLDHGPESSRFRKLREFLVGGVHGEAAPKGVLVVNLNLRSVTAGGAESLVERQLRSLLADLLWAPCEGCAFNGRCPLKHNADTLRDEASGSAVRERVRRLFEVVHLRRRAHVTMRDLRSALSWLLLRDHGCDDVARLFGSLDRSQEWEVRGARDQLVHLAYPAAFMADDGARRETVDDRLVRLLREADVGLVDEPRLDRRLDADPTAAVPWMALDGRSSYLLQLLQRWAEEGPRSADDGPLPQVLAARRKAVAMWRRWAFYERRDDGWNEMLPYRSLALLEGVLHASTEAERAHAALDVRDSVVEAVSLSEGLRHPEVSRKYLALRASRTKVPSIRSYRLFPREDFSVRVGAVGRATQYLEYAPDVVELMPTQHSGIANLRIPLDLMEMLELIRRGYRPSPADLQGLFVNLVIFRNELFNLPFERVLLTPDDESLFELAASTSKSGEIHLDLRRYDDTSVVGASTEGRS
jgi:serine/threonine protein kinase